MASTYLSNTPSSAGDRRTFTISTWFKISDINTWSAIISAGSSGNDHTELTFNASNVTNDPDIEFKHYNGSSFPIQLTTNRVFRDVNAWYHIVIKVDTTQATASDRVKMYINGVEETSFATSTYPSQNLQTNFNNTNIHTIGRGTESGTASTRVYWNGSLTHFHLTDGTAYDASYFGETDATTGIWKPKTAPSVTYGTNGVFLKFENSGSMGTDSSGNANNFTVNGTLTQTIDTPSNVFATLNALIPDGSVTLINGNTKVSAIGDNDWRASTLGGSFKWYAECKIDVAYDGSGGGICIGAISEDGLTENNGGSFSGLSNANTKWYTNSNDGKFQEGGGNNVTTGLTRASTGDIVGVACDGANGKIFIHVNGTYLNSGDPVAGTGFIGGTTGYNGIWFPYNGSHLDKGQGSWNFGNGFFGTTQVSSAQNPDDGIGIFEYDVPANYRALTTKSINAEEYD